MHPLPENLVYIARKGRAPIGIYPDGKKEFAEIWGCALHVAGSACSFGMLRAGRYAEEPPSVEVVWECLTAIDPKISATPIPSVLS